MLPPAPLNRYSVENYVHIGTFKKLLNSRVVTVTVIAVVQSITVGTHKTVALKTTVTT